MTEDERRRGFAEAFIAQARSGAWTCTRSSINLATRTDADTPCLPRTKAAETSSVIHERAMASAMQPSMPDECSAGRRMATAQEGQVRTTGMFALLRRSTRSAKRIRSQVRELPRRVASPTAWATAFRVSAFERGLVFFVVAAGFAMIAVSFNGTTRRALRAWRRQAGRGT